jgi:uncharacterized membrane-anchored protein
MVVASFAIATGSQAQEEPILGWTRGPGTAPIGSNLAEIDLTDAYVFLDADDSQRFMELNRNPVSGAELATVAPISQESNWFIIFEWEDSGYVPDDEKDSLDADAMLESIRTGTEAANKERRERGWPTMSIVGWHEMPHYDARTNNLSWAIVGRGDGGDTINRITKLLGRRGVMTATLVASPDELPAAIPEVDTLLDSYRFRPGSTYAEFVPGKDKLAKYGLTALVVGGAGAALVKSGLLAKIWKPLVVALAAAGAGIKRFFFGGRSSKHDPEKPLV